MKYDFYKTFKPTDKDWEEKDQAYKRFCKRYGFEYKPLKRDPVYPERTLADGSRADKAEARLSKIEEIAREAFSNPETQDINLYRAQALARIFQIFEYDL